MSDWFATLMRRAPEILIWLAIACYVSTVAISMTTGDAMVSGLDLGRETVSPLLKFKTIVLVFVRPLVNASALLFGAALLWRIDRMIVSRGTGAAI